MDLDHNWNKTIMRHRGLGLVGTSFAMLSELTIILGLGSIRISDCMALLSKRSKI